MRFQDRVVLITGAGSGIGLSAALAFAAEGARVVLVGDKVDKLTAAAPDVRAAGAPATLVSQCDVADEVQVAATVQTTLERFGRLDVIVNNAGLMIFRPLAELTAADWQRTLAVDLMGAFYFTREAFRVMPDGGAIVNVASIHAVQTTPQVAPYAAAKAALVSLTRSTSIEGKALNIRCNAVLPGAIDTDMLWENPNVKSGAEKIDKVDVGQCQDVAAAIVFLASAEACFIQGAALLADGGRLTHL